MAGLWCSAAFRGIDRRLRSSGEASGLARLQGGCTGRWRIARDGKGVSLSTLAVALLAEGLGIDRHADVCGCRKWKVPSFCLPRRP
jgi:hypothetical protein